MTTKKIVVLTLRCKRELEKEFNYIAENSPKQADIFIRQFEEIKQTISRMPTMGAIYKNGIRKMKLGKFKYYVYYREKETVIEILGIHHTSKGSGF